MVGFETLYNYFFFWFVKTAFCMSSLPKTLDVICFFFVSAEIIMLDGLTCVYRSNVDLFFYVMGSFNENEVC